MFNTRKMISQSLLNTCSNKPLTPFFIILEVFPERTTTFLPLKLQDCSDSSSTGDKYLEQLIIELEKLVFFSIQKRTSKFHDSTISRSMQNTSVLF